MKNNEWKLILHDGTQIADTGDYTDGYYELTNGEISLITEDDISEVEEDMLLSSFNGYDTKWRLDHKDADRADEAEYWVSHWKGIAGKLYNELKITTEAEVGIQSTVDALNEYRSWV